MSATEILRKDHREIKRLEKVVSKCYQKLYAGSKIPFTDIEKITLVISEFLDSIHYSREENSYFACVSSYETLNKEIHTFLVEHEFGRRIATKISHHLKRWKDAFFDRAENDVLSKEEEKEMFEQFQSIIAITSKIDEMIKVIDYLENQPWFKD